MAGAAIEIPGFRESNGRHQTQLSEEQVGRTREMEQGFWLQLGQSPLMQEVTQLLHQPKKSVRPYPSALSYNMASSPPLFSFYRLLPI